MKSGLLWFDKSSLNIETKIEQAARRYQEKFGTTPNTCFVNPQDLKSNIKIKGIKVEPKPTVMPNHIWLGSRE